MSEMVERVAKAIKESKRQGETITYEEAARAAIAAMREATDDMVWSAKSTDEGPNGWDGVRENWRAMIDEALRE